MTLVKTKHTRPAYVPYLLDVPEDLFPDLFTLYVRDCEEKGLGFLPPHLFIEKHRIRII